MTKTKSMIYCGLFTALIAAGAFIKNPYTCGSFYTAVTCSLCLPDCFWDPEGV